MQKEVLFKDVIYGNIEIEEPFLKFIACPEFIRLKFIKQTGFSYYDYPGLENNNRYEHSIGVFHLITRIINHLKIKLEEYNISIPEEEVLIAKTAMLLHDIGHGPYSHMFENIYDYPHELRTVDIIKGDTMLNKELNKIFDKQSIERMCNFLLEKKSTDKSPFIKMLKSLISSQIDADRMDYAVRDRYWAGLKTAIDHTRIIESMGISVDANQNYEVVIKQEELMFAECLLLERTQNFEHVYFSKSARLIEGSLFNKILELAKQEEIALPNMFSYFINLKGTLPLDMFLKLDDRVFDETLSLLHKNAKNPILKAITSKDISKKFIEVGFVDDFDHFKQTLLSNYTNSKNLDSCAIIKDFKHITLYKDHANIKVALGNQNFNFDQISLLIKNKTFNLDKVYFSPELLALEQSQSDQKISVDDIVKSNLSNTQEFELKYLVTTSNKNILDALTDYGFEIVEENTVTNTDCYFDTEKFDMLKLGGSLRTRTVTKNNQKLLKATYKIPKNQGQVFSQRNEIEDFCEPGFENLQAFLQSKHISMPNLLKDPILTAETNRTNFIVSYRNAKACISIDQTKYTNKNTSKIGKMVEIEALGDSQQRVILTLIYEILKNKLGLNKTISTSKYALGVELLKLN